MRVEDLRPCDGCGGPLLAAGVGVFYQVRVSPVMPKPDAVRAHVGLAVMFGGNEALAGVFSPDPEVAMVMGEQEAALYTHLLLCFTCYGGRPLAELVEARVAAAPQGVA